MCGLDLEENYGIFYLEMKATLNKEKSSSTPDEDKEGHEPVVSIANRALPLINLLAAAAKAGSNVMWE